jgi:hypothetical protein
MSQTNQSRSTGAAADPGREAALTWLRGMLAWEHRLAELEQGAQLRAAPPAPEVGLPTAAAADGLASSRQ